MRALCFVLLSIALVACGSSSNDTSDARPSEVIDAVMPDAAPGGEDASCFTNPTTHREIINACTNAEFVDKHPDLPLLLPGGGLPPLP